MQCREKCAACCIAPSIVHPLPNLPEGKPAGVVCANLDEETWRCRIWGQANYPRVCARFQPELEFCGQNRAEALQILSFMENETKPD